MYQNLKAEMTRYDIKSKEIAEKLNIQPSTASLKINGKNKITLDEAFAIQDLLFEVSKVEFSIEYLFKK